MVRPARLRKAEAERGETAYGRINKVRSLAEILPEVASRYGIALPAEEAPTAARPVAIWCETPLAAAAATASVL